jgi:hypothetical protein
MKLVVLAAAVLVASCGGCASAHHSDASMGDIVAADDFNPTPFASPFNDGGEVEPLPFVIDRQRAMWQ